VPIFEHFNRYSCNLHVQFTSIRTHLHKKMVRVTATPAKA